MTRGEFFNRLLLGLMIAAVSIGGGAYVATGLGKPWCREWQWPAVKKIFEAPDEPTETNP